MKFGGTSVGSSESINQVADIVNSNTESKVVVLSAFSGVTNFLVEINNRYKSGETNFSNELDQLQKRCLEVVNPLFNNSVYLNCAQGFIAAKMEEISGLLNTSFNPIVPKKIIAQGEIISTHVFQFFLQEKGIKSALISALDFMWLDEKNEPNLPKITQQLSSIINQSENCLFITQGFICNDVFGSVSNLDRGGSDYTASLIGAALQCNQIQIWTDIDGMHNNDPRFVENTFSIEEVSFDEAAELAYFGAKILHPQSLIPAKNNNIPVLLKNTFSPEKKGTVIKNKTSNSGVTSIAAKDNIIAIKIKSYRMLLAYGFLKNVFEVFETYQTPIDMITTSEVAVSLTIDNDQNLSQIVEKLQEFGSVEVDRNLSIVCVAGDFSQNKEGISGRIFGSLQHIPIRMISYGGSNYNVSLLVKTTDKVATLNALNTKLFTEKMMLESV